jgi:hypothetical protein
MQWEVAQRMVAPTSCKVSDKNERWGHSIRVQCL